jgi:hypothetical protein
LVAQDSYLQGDAVIVALGTDVEGIGQASSATCIRDDIVLETPLLSENVSQNVLVGHNWDAVVGVVGRHDRVGITVHDGSLERREVKAP